MKRPRWLQDAGCIWAAAGAAAGLVILVGVLAFTALARSAARGAQKNAPMVTLIPRASPTPLATPSPTALPTDTPEPVISPDASSGRIEVGSLVEVYGTEGDGLRLRASPGTEGTIQLLASESEVFSVQDGPVEANDRTWFYLVSPSDAARAGWAVSDYLRLVQ